MHLCKQNSNRPHAIPKQPVSTTRRIIDVEINAPEKQLLTSSNRFLRRRTDCLRNRPVKLRHYDGRRPCNADVASTEAAYAQFISSLSTTATIGNAPLCCSCSAKNHPTPQHPVIPLHHRGTLSSMRKVSLQSVWRHL